MPGFNIATTLSLFISFLSLFVALSAGLPALGKLYINRAYNPPGVEIDIQYHADEEPVPWYELDPELMREHTNDSRVTAFGINIYHRFRHQNAQIEKIEVANSQNWDLKRQYQQVAQLAGVNRYSIPPQALAFDGLLTTGISSRLQFPFQPEPEGCEFEVSVYTIVSASEFRVPIIGRWKEWKFPRYFGNVKLEPVSESIMISGEE